jgi:hypothetical protein
MACGYYKEFRSLIRKINESNVMKSSVYIHSEVRQNLELTVLIYTVVTCWNLAASS